MANPSPTAVVKMLANFASQVISLHVYDARTDTLRFVGNAQVRRLRGNIAAEDIQGSVIVWDNAAELFSVQGGAATPGNPGGRVRAVLSPRTDPAAAASAPSPSPALQPSTSLGERR